MSGDVPFLSHPERVDAQRVDLALIRDAHDRAVGLGQAVYRDPSTGLMVFTAVALKERDWCCERGCRHCPYPTLHGPLPGAQNR